MLLISAGSKAWFNRKILSHPILVWIGLISYPLYLWHWPMLSYLHVLYEGAAVPAVFRIGAVIISIVLAWLTYIIIERPIRSNNKNSKLAIALTFSMIAVGVIGYQTSKHPPSRVGSRITKLDEQRAVFNTTDNTSVNCPDDILKTPLNKHCAQAQKDVTATVVFVGDSHASILFQGFSPLYQERKENLLLLEFSGCAPYIGIESYPSGDKDVCLKNVSDGYDYIVAHANLKTVLISSRGPLYFTGIGYGEDGFDMNIRYVKDPNNRNAAEVLKTAMVETLNKLIQANKEVIFFIDTPELGFRPHECLESRVVFPLKKRDPCGVSFEEYKSRNRLYLSSVMEVLKKFPTVKIFDQSKQVCDDKFCHAIRDNTIIFRDDDHLSYAGSVYMAERFKQEFF